MSSSQWTPPTDLQSLKGRAGLVGGIGLAVSAVGFAVDSTRLVQSYLVSWLFWTCIAMGCLAILMLHHLTRGAWGLMIRRCLEAATRTLPALALLFIPILLRLEDLYSWARPEAAADPLIQHKAIFLNPVAFSIRSVLYFAIWILFAWALNRMSLQQDLTGDAGLFRRLQMVAAPGLGIYCLLASFAAIDWLMSLDPHWYSSIFGVYFIAGQGVAAFAFIIIVALYLFLREPMSRTLRPHHFHDYGKLLLAFVMIWSYIAVSQLLIIWSGHLPEEIPWYLERTRGGWKWVAIALILFHFLLPFLLLLSRDLKRSARSLSYVAVGVLVMRWVDLYWQAAPTFHHGPVPSWLDLATMAGVGGIWVALFAGQLQKRSLLPVNDPYLEEALDLE